jgi:kynurenine formamidase
LLLFPGVPPVERSRALGEWQAGLRIERVVDLSIVLDEGTQTYPGDPVPGLSVATTIEADGFNLLHVRIGSQSGTHVDAPYHFIAEGPVLEDTPLHRFVGPGVVVDVSQHDPRQPITWPDLEPWAERFGPGTIVALRTAWSDRHLGTDRYFAHPFLEVGACRRLLDLGVRTVAIDALNVDETVVDGEPAFPCHLEFLGAGGVFSENLTNLGAIDFPDPLIMLMPIRLGGDADGAPCRAVALDVRPV